MKTSDATRAHIAQHEGLRLEAYLCPANVWTIGYGHTKGVTKGMIITKDQAEALLSEDLAVFEENISKRLPGLNQNQFDALVSFAFNVGNGAFNTSTLYRKAKQNPNDPTIRNEFAKWVHAGGRVLPGLVKRRAWEADLYFS